MLPYVTVPYATQLLEISDVLLIFCTKHYWKYPICSKYPFLTVFLNITELQVFNRLVSRFNGGPMRFTVRVSQDISIHFLNFFSKYTQWCSSLPKNLSSSHQITKRIYPRGEGKLSIVILT